MYAWEILLPTLDLLPPLLIISCCYNLDLTLWLTYKLLDKYVCGIFCFFFRNWLSIARTHGYVAPLCLILTWSNALWFERRSRFTIILKMRTHNSRWFEIFFVADVYGLWWSLNTRWIVDLFPHQEKNERVLPDD